MLILTIDYGLMIDILCLCLTKAILYLAINWSILKSLPNDKIYLERINQKDL